MRSLNSRFERDWYAICMECLADLEHHAEHHGRLHDAFAPWCALCASAAEALNDDRSEADHVDYLNGTHVARWLLHRLNYRLW